MTHTATPWYTVDAGDEYCFDIDTKTEAGWPVTLATTGRENATFIVRACNSHDALVEALEEMIDLYGVKSDISGGLILEQYQPRRIASAMKALKLAKGE